ncbi:MULTISPECIES: DUF5397 family protein [Gammaproteobacteria]|uniref:Uncharacterized protein n=5 Tax=cellular organisms TaxID=131567 RepID=A0A1S1HNG0_PROST|nr:MULTISPECIES: DUF5397 family protein [Gammaproteobacteria]OHT23628.1 hypothetical protein A3Q29_20565 [Providencia stuartii]ALV81731.1 hypothetical protein AOY08_100011 [Providencia rettgeri]ELR5224367.1 DUF5397 family protein [Providencia rettgeri]MBQ0329363.1 DUF5397 family protein [Providencia rettgeri]MBS0861789.1 DUF5397 family protein [Providencia rettgeri]
MMTINKIPTGAIKTFGNYGVLYQVGEKDSDLPDGDILVNITLLESGEKEKYKLSQLIEDPEAK